MSATAENVTDLNNQAGETPVNPNLEDPGNHDVGKEETLLDKVKKDPQLLQFIKTKADEIIELEKQAKKINEAKSLIREEVVEKGINRHSFAAAVARQKLTETDREERELSYQVCCHALGVEHQLDLLDGLGETTH